MTTRSPNDLIDTLLEQHDRIRRLLAEVESTGGPARRRAFDALRELLAVHEAGEEIVLRSVSGESAGKDVAEARNREEDRAARQLAELEKLDPDSRGFTEKFAEFAAAVRAHADREERDEFPAVRADHSPGELHDLGNKFLAAERRAPTHPHPAAAGSPTAQRTAGPFAALLDKAKDAFNG